MYVDQVPGHLAGFVEARLREAVAEAKRQDAALPRDHWTRHGGPASVMVAMVPGPIEGAVSESLVEREMRRVG